MKEKTIEICCVNYEDCIHADVNGADRIELCASMAAGGLTPSLGLFQMVKEHVSIPIMVMIRPRGAGFCYNKAEFEIMKRDAEIFLSNGADGCVFGFLNADKTVDCKRSEEFAALIRKYGKEAVFHRAIDECPNKTKAIQLQVCGNIRSHNALRIAESTGIDQLHSACRMFRQDESDEPSAELNYHNAYDGVDAQECSRLAAALR